MSCLVAPFVSQKSERFPVLGSCLFTHWHLLQKNRRRKGRCGTISWRRTLCAWGRVWRKIFTQEAALRPNLTVPPLTVHWEGFKWCLNHRSESKHIAAPICLSKAPAWLHCFFMFNDCELLCDFVGTPSILSETVPEIKLKFPPKTDSEHLKAYSQIPFNAQLHTVDHVHLISSK